MTVTGFEDGSVNLFISQVLSSSGILMVFLAGMHKYIEKLGLNDE